MAKKKKSDLESLIEFLMMARLFYVVYKWLFQTSTSKTSKNYLQRVGIHGPQYRIIEAFFDDYKNDITLQDLLKLDNVYRTEVINLIMQARETPELKMPLYKQFKNSPISGELRDQKWRVFLKNTGKNKFIIVSFFKKKSDATPKSEIIRAENRINSWIKK